jgi:hypothetical protein
MKDLFRERDDKHGVYRQISSFDAGFVDRRSSDG